MPDKYSPRNEWSHILDTLVGGQKTHAERLSDLEGLQYSKGLTPATLDVVARYARARAREDSPRDHVEKLNLPSDMTRNRSGLLRLPFRRLHPRADPVSPYPFDLALPEMIASFNNYAAFFQAAPRLFSATGGALTQKILVLYTARDEAATLALMSALARQRGLAELTVVVFVPDGDSALSGIVHRICPAATILTGTVLGAAADALIQGALDDVDGVAFLDGDIEMDARAFDRASYLLQISDKIVQGLWPVDRDTIPGASPYAINTSRAFTRRYPFRDMRGCNMLVPSALLRRTGGLDPRFATAHYAALELGWRCYNLGAWFAPLLVERVAPEPLVPDHPDTGMDQGMFRSLSPSSWDRPKDGHYDVPKVSVYIPAYNCAKYIERAIDSVLGQDFQDLEVCVAIDGSPDATEEVLRRRYGEEGRVRFANDANGGIGHASNRAIHMSRGLYIGQLDSDDSLKPGAVRRLAEYLDENATVACCYGSCERVDAEGRHLQAEYSWPEFSREKMMVTSIVHHFRMFRRAAWERTSKFRSDIANAVDYDIFLKLSETGRMHHVDEILYERRWHGENTSSVNEGFQTTNTYRVQRQALRRLNLERVWDAHVPDPDRPRRVTYRRDPSIPRVFFWPDYAHSNPYQQLLYQQITDSHEVVAAPIEVAARVLLEKPGTAPVIFHLHWTNFLFRTAADAIEAKARAAEFLQRLETFRSANGRIIWTIHNRISHDTRFPEIESHLIRRVIGMCDILHFHSAASVAEMEQDFAVPRHKVRIAPHGSYLGVYPDHIDRAAARAQLDIAETDEVIVHTGQVRPYKGIETLIAAFRALLPERPNLRLLIAGSQQQDILATLQPPLSAREKGRIMNVNRFLDEYEFQLFYRAADIAVFPYQSILTSGSLLLALSFGVPAVVPAVGMTREVLGDGKGGRVYEPNDSAALCKSIAAVLGQGPEAKVQALEKARATRWTGLKAIFDEMARLPVLSLHSDDARV